MIIGIIVERITFWMIKSTRLGIVVLSVDPDFMGIPNYDFVAAVTGEIEHGVAHFWMAIVGKTDHTSAPSVKQATLCDIRRKDKKFAI